MVSKKQTRKKTKQKKQIKKKQKKTPFDRMHMQTFIIEKRDIYTNAP